MIVVPVLLLLACQAVAVLAAPLFNCVGGTVYVVAHADDDLLFQSPDLYTDVSNGACVTTVIFSAGDSGTTGTTYSNSREVGNQEAYSFMATGKSGGKSVYTEVIGTLGGQPVTVRTLAAAPQVQRVYFRLPDGNMDGSGFPTTGYQSLRMLYFGSISSITNQPQTATFTLATLKQALAEILVARQPSYVRTLDYMSDFDSGDHADHLTVGRITNEVAGQYSNATISGYMGYPVSNFAPTLSTSDAAFKNKANAFFQYTPYDSAECQAYAACVAAGRGESYWLTRQYVVNSYLAQMSYQGVAQTPVTLPKGQDIARQADVTASSEWPTQPAEAAIDGKVQGYPGNSSAEWCSYGETVGAWIRLDWDDPWNITDIVLNDRPNLNDWMTGGTLTFADNATVSFGALANDGSATLISLGGSGGSVVTDSIFLYVTSVSSSTTQVGLAEFQVFGTRCKGCTIGSNLKNSTTTQTSQGSSSGVSSSIDLALSAKATSSSSALQQGPEKANDGYVDGYKEDGTGIYSEEWASYGETTGAWINLTWPAYYMIDSLVFHDRPNKNDWITGGVVKFSDGNSLKVTSLDNKGGATVFNLTSPVNVSSLLFTVTSTGQQTSSAGLAEIEAYYSLPQTPVSITSPSTNKTITLPVQGDLGDAEDWENDLALLPGVVATASSSSPGQGPANAINGDPNGYKDDGTGDAYQEWASYYEGVGTWINLTFPNPIQVSQISLFDRPNAADQITGGRFAFSNGQLVSVGALYNNGSGTTFSIPDIQTTSIKFTVTSISSTTSSAGLSEFAVFGKVLNSTQYASSGSNATATPTSNSTAAASATSSAPTSIFTGEQIQRSLDLAVNATASASSYAPGQGPEKAIDTYVDGYKESGTGMPYQEWASYGGGVGTTFTLTWPSNVTVDAVVLYDRPNLNDQITSGTLTFDSGNVYQIGTLPNNSTGKAIVINHETTSKIVLTVTGVSSTTSSAGLAEFAVYGSAGGNGTSTITSSASASSATASGSLISGSANSTSSVPTSTSSAASSIFTGEQIQRSLDLAVNATASASSYAPGQGPEKATDTYVDGYKESGTGMPYQEWASYGGGVGTTFTLTWPSNVTVDAVVLYDRPNLNDQLTSGTLTFDSGNVYQVGSLPNAGTGKAIVIDHETTSQIVLTVTGVSSTTSSVGLAEFAVYGSAGGNGTSTITSSASASSAPSTASSASLNSTVVSGNASVATSAALNSSASAVPTGSVSLNASSVSSSTGLNSSAALPVPTGFNSSFALPSSTGFNYSSVLPSSTGLNSSAAFPSAIASNSSVLPSATPSGFNLSSSALPSASANGPAVLPSSSLASNASAPLPSSTFAPSASSSLNISSNFASSTAAASANLTSSASVPVSTASQNFSLVGSSSSTLSSSATASSASSSSVLPSSASSALSASSSVQPASSRVSSTISSSASMVVSTRPSSASSTALPSSSSVASSSSKIASSTSAAPTGLPTAPAQAATVNIARLSGVKVTASSSISKSPPAGAIDGNVGGVSTLGFGNAAQEWVSNGVKGQWIELNWPQKYLMKDIILYGRLNNVAGGIASGSLNFTDGTIIKVGSLSSSGSHVSLGDGLTVSGVRFTVGAGTLLSSAAGLAEFEIFNKPAPSYGLVGTLGNVVGQTLGDVLGIVGLRE